ncbi:E3 ubiquitin-protein ligase RNF180 isoform X2 [Mugil cephalus]|uniref:E3 ubiquitin-protein ligase RNF180 isoform X2 n=1 Tax=Mugil cephalus TaxID=48193 RepID=UPI001FB5A83B|nr:E3 ubiquitin-protein ligase RNF180 isoform X2 [Mugil cephalus]
MAQWTVGKLNCQNCGARLGGFNFVNRTECPCGQDASIHLSKSRVDHDHKHNVLIVQPRRTMPERVQAGLLANGSQDKEEMPGFNRSALDASQLGTSHISPPEASSSLTQNTQTFSFSPLYCISHRRRCSLEDDADLRSSCFCPVGSKAMSSIVRSGTDETTWSPLSFRTSRQCDVPCRSSVSGGTRSTMDQHLLRTEENFLETTAVHEELSDSVPSLRERFIANSVAEQEEEEGPQAVVDSPASNRMSKREKNHLKSLRRKERRRKRWLHSQLTQDQAESMRTDSEEEDKEGLTCAVCLDIYFNPYSCQPCGHVFCEPCLRTLAKNRPTNTPCPLCRSLISHTSFHKELNHTAKTFFPKVYFTRKQNFQNASCAKWPLPSFPKRFRYFWGNQRRGGRGGRHWHFVHGGFTLEALDFTDMRGWLFDIGLVIVYMHSLNWILAFLFLCFLMYYFFI